MVLFRGKPRNFVATIFLQMWINWEVNWVVCGNAALYFYLYTSFSSLNLYVGQVRLFIQIGHRVLFFKLGCFKHRAVRFLFVGNIQVIEPME